jgi:GT2 family glycosyltransferase
MPPESSTPRVAFYRLTGLSRLFPNSQVMARYNLTYVDPDQPHEVDAVSGACLLIRRQVVDQIGLLDEEFWIFGEDIDWCILAQKAGGRSCTFRRRIHYKDRAHEPRKTSFEFTAMYLFHCKHFAGDCARVVNFLIYAGIVFKATLALPRFFLSARFTHGSRDRKDLQESGGSGQAQGVAWVEPAPAEKPRDHRSRSLVPIVPYAPNGAKPPEAAGQTTRSCRGPLRRTDD